MSSKLFVGIRKRFVPSFWSLNSMRHNSALTHEDLNWYKSRHRWSQPRLRPSADQLRNADDHLEHAPSNHEFDIVSFNLLAPVYKRLTSKNAVTGRRHREAGDYSLWSERLVQTMDFFRTEIYRDAAIIALQEYWLDARYRRIFEEQFHQHGYECRVMQRPGAKADAVALVIKSDIFEIRAAENIHLCTFGDRVALLLWLRHRSTGFDLLVANTHLSFPHNVLDRLNQVAQMKHLTGVIETFARTHNVTTAPALIMGDFNVEAHSPVCDHLRSTGYYSAFEICPPINTSPNRSAVGEANDVLVQTEYVSVTTNETCVLPNHSARSARSDHEDGSDAQEHGSKRELTDCDDIGDTCVVDQHTNVTTTTTTTTTERISSTVSYVSHFNHRNEQVGVDHIFLKPLPSLDPEDESHAWTVVQAGPDSAVAKPSQSTGEINDKHSNSEGDRQSAPQTPHSLRPSLFVAECQVLPKSVTCSSWYPQFQISDHRPVRAKMIFTHNQNQDK